MPTSSNVAISLAVPGGDRRLRTVALASTAALAAAGAACTATTTMPGPDAPPVGNRQDELYAHDVVQTIALDIAPADLTTLEGSTTLADWVYVPATFTWNDVVLANVGVRYKGNSSRVPGVKRSFLIKFDEYVPDQDFLGLVRMGLDNGIQFGSLFSERLIDDILLAEGVPATRTNYARLTINGTDMGVYVNLERIDKRFLARNFADKTGDLYKCDVGGPGAKLEYLGDDPTAYTGLALQTNDTTSDGSALIDLVRTLDSGTDAELEAVLDTDSLVAVMPAMMFAGAFDQYTGFNVHNYYLYDDPSTGKWTYLPHDLDVGFSDNAFGMIPVIDGWDAANPRPLPAMPLVDRLLDDPALRDRYLAAARDQLDRYFAPAALGAKLDALYAQIADALVTDPFPNYRITQPSVVGYDAIVADLKTFMQRRYDTAKASLAN